MGWPVMVGVVEVGVVDAERYRCACTRGWLGMATFIRAASTGGVLVCNKVLIKRPTTPKSHCNTTLRRIVNHNACFRYFSLTINISQWFQGAVGHFTIALLEIPCKVCW